MTQQADDLKAMEELLASIREAIHEHTARQAAGLAVEGVDGGGPAVGNEMPEAEDMLGAIDDLDDDIVMLDSVRAPGMAEENAPLLSPRNGVGSNVALRSEASCTEPFAGDPLLEEPASAPPLDAAFLTNMMKAPQRRRERAVSGRLTEPTGEEEAERISRAGRVHAEPAANVHNGLLERQVQRVLEPLLERWMEERLPQLVEELVREELRRLLDPDRPARSHGQCRVAG